MVLDIFQSILAIFLFACGATLILAAWPRDPDWPAATATLTLILGSVMVTTAGFALALALPMEALR